MSGVKIGIGFGLWNYGLPDAETICGYAELAEAVGLDSIWLSDHIVTRNPTLDISCLSKTQYRVHQDSSFLPSLYQNLQ